MTKRLVFMFGLTLLGLFLFVGTPAVSAQTGANPDACKASSGQFLGFPTWYKYLSPQQTSNGCELKFDAKQDIPKVLLALFEIIMRILGIVAVFMVVWGGLQYVISQGEPEATKNARTTIINALIGVAIAISATAIVNLIGNNLIK